MQNERAEQPRLLLVDDDRAYLSSLLRVIRRSDVPDFLEIDSAGGGEEAVDKFGGAEYRILITDLKMPGIDGEQVAREALDRYPDCYVIVITAQSDVKQAIELIQKGIYDYLPKPFEVEELILKIRRIIHEIGNEREILRLQDELRLTPEQRHSLVYVSPQMGQVVQTVSSVADTDFPILITGESGTGKELVADLVQSLSARRGEEYVKLNCAGLVPTLLESEMFGHEKGAFTGAIKDKMGKFEQADRGTHLSR